MMIRLILILIGLLCFAHPAVSSSKHVYVNGRVEAMFDRTLRHGGDSEGGSWVSSGTEKMIRVNGQDYVLAKKVKVITQDRNSNGSFYEEKSSMSNVYTGASVTVKAFGSYVNEIVIERWKR